MWFLSRGMPKKSLWTIPTKGRRLTCSDGSVKGKVLSEYSPHTHRYSDITCRQQPANVGIVSVTHTNAKKPPCGGWLLHSNVGKNKGTVTIPLDHSRTVKAGRHDNSSPESLAASDHTRLRADLKRGERFKRPPTLAEGAEDRDLLRYSPHTESHLRTRRVRRRTSDTFISNVPSHACAMVAISASRATLPSQRLPPLLSQRASMCLRHSTGQPMERVPMSRAR